MNNMDLSPEIQLDELDTLIEHALREDLGEAGDLTTLSTIPVDSVGRGQLNLKESGVIAGLAVFSRVFQKVDPSVSVSFFVADGDGLESGTNLGHIQGPMRSILVGERTALNFLQRLSGIATQTRCYVEAVKETRARILDTRKTTPHYRILEKYAVRQGGGENHRMGLYDMVLIKDNHIEICGGITQAVQQCLSYLNKKKQKIKIEVETRTLREVEEALGLPVHRIMLDNMDQVTMRRAVEMIDGRVEVEASGNITLELVGAVAKTGVDFISVGALTHSVRALDISLAVVSSPQLK